MAFTCLAGQDPELKAGFSRTDITPPLGVDVPGYFPKRIAKSVLDPLQVNCTAFADGRSTALGVSAEGQVLWRCSSSADRDMRKVVRIQSEEEYN